MSGHFSIHTIKLQPDMVCDVEIHYRWAYYAGNYKLIETGPYCHSLKEAQESLKKRRKLAASMVSANYIKTVQPWKD